MLVNRIFNKEEFTSNLSSVIKLARKANVPIFFTRIRKQMAANIYFEISNTYTKACAGRITPQRKAEDDEDIHSMHLGFGK
jgi:hypothetical protein